MRGGRKVLRFLIALFIGFWYNLLFKKNKW